MADVSTVVGITFMVIGSLLVTIGLALCYVQKVSLENHSTFLVNKICLKLLYHLQGEYYNQEEVQAMVAAEVLEEEKRKQEELAQLEMDLEAMAMAKKTRRKGPMVAT